MRDAELTASSFLILARRLRHGELQASYTALCSTRTAISTRVVSLTAQVAQLKEHTAPEHASLVEQVSRDSREQYDRLVVDNCTLTCILDSIRNDFYFASDADKQLGS